MNAYDKPQGVFHIYCIGCDSLLLRDLKYQNVRAVNLGTLAMSLLGGSVIFGHSRQKGCAIWQARAYKFLGTGKCGTCGISADLHPCLPGKNPPVAQCFDCLRKEEGKEYIDDIIVDRR